MNYFSSIKEVIRHPVLSFDRSFSERGTRQLYWLSGAVVTVFAILFLISLFLYCCPIKLNSSRVHV